MGHGNWAFASSGMVGEGGEPHRGGAGKTFITASMVGLRNTL